MREYAGIWIDRTRAVIVSLLGEEKTITTIKSHLEGRVRSGDNLRTAESQITAGAGPEENLHFRTHAFCRDVISAISDPYSIIILGPDEMRGALEQAIKAQADLASKIAGVEQADIMTEDHIADRVRFFFKLSADGCDSCLP